MKKIFGLLATAVLAVCGLSSCGGGGGDAKPETMSIKEFTNGTKYFQLGKGDRTLYIKSLGGQTAVSNDKTTEVRGLKVELGIGGLGNTEAWVDYKIVTTNKETGDPETALLIINALDITAGQGQENSIREFLGFEPIEDDGDAGEGDAGNDDAGNGDAGDEEEKPTTYDVQVELDFVAHTWTNRAEPLATGTLYVRSE